MVRCDQLFDPFFATEDVKMAKTKQECPQCGMKMEDRGDHLYCTTCRKSVSKLDLGTLKSGRPANTGNHPKAKSKR